MSGYIIHIEGIGNSYFPTKKLAEEKMKYLSKEGYEAYMYQENKLPKKYQHIIGKL